MTYYLRICSILTFLLVVKIASGQYFSTGEDPSNIKWKQINTSNYRIVFSDDFEYEAKKISVILNEIWSLGGYTLHHQPKKFNILLHNKSIFSNGNVVWAPKRMELYPSFNQKSIGTNILNQLIIHEYRHIIQLDVLEQGFTKALSYILGEQATGAITGLHFPRWYLEGDATLSETLLSNSGRGRSAKFEKGLRAQSLEKDIYSYDKAYFGSYKNFVPDYYEMGYHLVTGARVFYNPYIWKKATNKIVQKSYFPFAFSNSIKDVTGLNKTGLYYSVYKKITDKWHQQDIAVNRTPYKSITSSGKQYKNYISPIPLNDNKIITETNGPDHISKIVEINNTGNEKTILSSGPRNNDRISAVNNLIAWSEYKPHIRWNNANFSNIKIYDTNTNKTLKLTYHSNYFSPIISPDKTKLAAVHVSDNNQFSLHIFDLQTNQLIDSINTKSIVILTPCWDDKSENVISVLMNSDGKALGIFNFDLKRWSYLSNTFITEIRNPICYNQSIYFTGSWSGIDNIYRFDLPSKKMFQVTSDRFGADYASIDNNNNLLYCYYTSNGYKIAQMPLDSTLNIALDSVKNTSISLYKPLVNRELKQPKYNFSNLDTIQIKKYSKWNLFNFHSWAPAQIDATDRTIQQGATVMSQNLLNTMIFEVGYKTGKSHRYEKFNTKLSYKGWFPTIDLELKLGDQIGDKGIFTSGNDTILISNNYRRWIFQLSPSISLPLNLTSSKYYRMVIPSIKYQYYKNSKTSYFKRDIHETNDGLVVSSNTQKVTIPAYYYHGINHELYLYNLLKRPVNSIIHKWGQIVQLNYQHNPFGDKNNGTQLSLLTRLYTPGFMLHHGFRIENGYQVKKDGETISSASNDIYEYKFHFNSIVTLPRGYYPDHYSQKIYSFKGDYIFPLWNPDISIGGLYYLKRIKTNLFVDYSWTEKQLKNRQTSRIHTSQANLSSLGCEWRFEGHIFRFVFPFDLGIRYSYLPNEKHHYTEFLWSVNIN